MCNVQCAHCAWTKCVEWSNQLCCVSEGFHIWWYIASEQITPPGLHMMWICRAQENNLNLRQKVSDVAQSFAPLFTAEVASSAQDTKLSLHCINWGWPCRCGKWRGYYMTLQTILSCATLLVMWIKIAPHETFCSTDNAPRSLNVTMQFSLSPANATTVSWFMKPVHPIRATQAIFIIWWSISSSPKVLVPHTVMFDIKLPCVYISAHPIRKPQIVTSKQGIKNSVSPKAT